MAITDTTTTVTRVDPEFDQSQDRSNGDMSTIQLEQPDHLKHTSSASTVDPVLSPVGSPVNTLDDGFNLVKEHTLDIDPSKSIDPHGLRTATAQSAFFLIVTDVLGPAKVPWTFAQLGYVPGFLVYFFLGFISLYCSYLLWQLFMRLDQPDRRIVCYSDLCDRVFGKTARNVTNVLQSLQLLLNVSVVILGNAQGLSQIAEAKVCFIVLALLWMIGGAVIGQVRALQNFRSLSHISVALNFAVIFIVMGVVHHSLPNYAAAWAQNGIPYGVVAPVNFISGTKWTQQLVGVMNVIYSYSGAILFLEMMAEMKNPKDFIKSLVSAQAVIMITYIVFGCVVYSKHGQFTINPANQGIGLYSYQTVTNVFNLVSSLIAACLYGNIGLKVLYQTVIVEIFNGPELASPQGRKVWTCAVIGYWICSFLITGAIPQLSNISGIIAAVCMVQFTFTFPAGLMLAYDLQAQKAAGKTFWQKFTLSNITHVILILAALTLAGLGLYSAIVNIIDSPSAAVAFGCASPV